MVQEDFYVQRVYSRPRSNSHTPLSEMVFGGKSPRYETGDSNHLILEVFPRDIEIPIRKLTFNGPSVVRGKDKISAHIPRYDQESDPTTYSSDPHRKVFYFDRDFNTEETAIKIEIYNWWEGDLLREDKSVEYSKFFSK